MPGIGGLPNDLIMLMQVNQFFIDAFMVGANVEMNRELLWRGFPTDLRGTPFQRFWDRRGLNDEGRPAKLPDMLPIHRWGVQPLGKRTDPNITDPDRVALIIKGTLLRRYPNTAVYAWKRAGAAPPGSVKLQKNADGEPLNADSIQLPVFAGTIAPDITFFGFDIDRADIAQWCFVLEEQMTEPRFGFDVPVPPPGQSARQHAEGARLQPVQGGVVEPGRHRAGWLRRAGCAAGHRRCRPRIRQLPEVAGHRHRGGCGEGAAAAAVPRLLGRAGPFHLVH